MLFRKITARQAFVESNRFAKNRYATMAAVSRYCSGPAAELRTAFSLPANSARTVNQYQGLRRATHVVQCSEITTRRQSFRARSPDYLQLN
jgi:hypothetical protein